MNQDTIRGFVSRIESLEAERAATMQRFSEDTKSVYDEAKVADINIKALKALIGTRKLERRMEATVGKLEDDERADYERLAADLGDFANTPLGEAAIERARANDDIDALNVDE